MKYVYKVGIFFKNGKLHKELLFTSKIKANICALTFQQDYDTVTNKVFVL